MLRFTVFALLVAVAAARYTAMAPIRAIPCGSKANVREIRFTNCANLPCTVVKGSNYDLEIDFEPSTSHEVLDFSFSLIQGGLEHVIVQSPLQLQTPFVAGAGYTVSYPWVPREDVSGLVALRMTITGDNVSEVCSLATARLRDIIF